jgi:hypothetical protein
MAISLLLFFGCGGKENHQEESTLLRSYRLIDNDKADDAISLLSDEIDQRDNASADGLDTSAETTELRVTLASAYAKKAGITIHEISQSYVLAKKISDIKLQNDFENFQTENDRKITDISKLLLGQIKIAQTLTVIPKVNSENIVYLHQAVKILDSAPNLTTADLVYSSILKIVLVRSMIESDSLKSILPKASDINKDCVADFSNFKNYLLKTTKILLGSFDDLIKALPEKSSDIVKTIADIKELSENIASVNAAGIVIYNVNRSTLNSLYRFFNVSPQEITCGAN